MKKAVVIIIVVLVACMSVSAADISMGVMQNFMDTSFIVDAQFGRFGVEGAVGIPLVWGTAGIIDCVSKGQQVTISALEYIDHNYKDGTLEELAAATGYSTAYLSRLLKSYTGQNFKQLLQTRKLQQAAYYLENTTLTTEKIIEKIGYENSAYFYKKFSEKYGCSPREYRQKH